MSRFGRSSLDWRPLFAAGCALVFGLPLLAGGWQLLAEGLSPAHLQRLLAQPGLWHSALL
ncbi:ABC transporter permease, partial [Aeromonas hydrophila]